MGCTHFNRITTEHEVMSRRLSQIIAEKNIFYKDKIMLESEVTQLKKYACQVVHESETIKAKFDEHQSTICPEVFETANSESGLVADWLEMDWKDGDCLLDAMTSICPSALPEIESLKFESANLRDTRSTLRDFLAYFLKRYDFFNAAWRDALAAQKQIDISTQHLKEDIVAGIQAVESFVGKRSEIDDELHTEFRRIAALPPSEFLVEQRNIMQRLITLRTEMMRKKLDEKDIEKQRVIHLFQHEIAKINEKHQAEQTRSKAELMKEYGDQLKKEFNAQAEQFKSKEKQYQSQIYMLSEDLLANTVRLRSKQESIRNTLNEEIEQHAKEINQLQQAMKEERFRISVQKSVEIQQAKKEAEVLRKEMSRMEQIHQKEIDELDATFSKKEMKVINDAKIECDAVKKELSRKLEEHKEEIEELETIFSKKEMKMINDAKVECEAVQKELSRTLEEHKGEIAKLKAAFEIDKSEIFVKANIGCETLKSEMNRQLEEHREEIAHLKEIFVNKESTITTEARIECETLKNKVIAAEEHYRAEIEQFKMSFAKKESSLLKNAIMESERLKKELIKSALVHKGEIEQLQSDFSEKEAKNLQQTQIEQEALKTEMKQMGQSHQKEIERLNEELTEELEKLQQQHLSELEDQSKIFEVMKNDFSARLDAQKLDFDQKLVTQRSNHSSELNSVRQTITFLTQEIKTKDMQQKDILEEVSKQRRGESLQQQLSSVLQSKLDLVDVESEGRIRSIAARYFPRFRSKDDSATDVEMEKMTILAKLRATTDFKKTTSSDQLAMGDDAMNVLKRQNSRFESILSEFDAELRLMKNQFEQVSIEKTDIESQVTKLRTQMNEKNKRLAECETTIDLLKKQIMRTKADRKLSIPPTRILYDSGPPSPTTEIATSPKHLDTQTSIDSIRQSETPSTTSMTITGPVGTPYENREYRIMIETGPEFPQKPPKVKFLTKINMNGVDKKTGLVDSSLKGISGWNENWTIDALLLGIKKEMTSPSNKKLLQHKKVTSLIDN